MNSWLAERIAFLLRYVASFAFFNVLIADTLTRTCALM